ncbi:MAG: Phosphoethanolamine transferase EptC [Paracidovorax wautersii]|uniref:Phosphoethanolamine transferase EptC n=1 Tax=Paracidovorax wautersii TaxID=1177982 RepID=A0A7V8FN63_9BURK|nr:MAG: Phosphoethanolamine transferase EptC [Paracidovorax wautersii]
MSWLGTTGLLMVGLAGLALAFVLRRAQVAWPAGRVRQVLGVWLPLALLVPLTVAAVVDEVRKSRLDEQAWLQKAVAYRMGGLPRAMLISYPAGVPLRVLNYVRQEQATRIIRNHINGMSFGATRARALPPGVQREVYVLVLGESLRADHLQINGYPRETTPNLAAAGGQVVSLPDFVSAASITRLAVPPLFTRRLPQTDGAFTPEPSVLKAFKEAGFKTYWLTTQAPFGKNDAGISMVLAQADEVRAVSPEGWRPGVYDSDLLPWIDEVLAKTDEPRQLIVLHTRGSHAQYSLRYAPEQTHFQPAAPSDAAVNPWDAGQVESLRNAYDNSVRATDAFAAQVMQRVARATDSQGQGWLMFVSDHGETLFDGQCGRAGHGFASSPNFHTAAFIWPTPSFARLNGPAMAASRANAPRPADYRVMFHTLLDLAGVSVPVHDPALSLASATYRPATRRLIDAGTGSIIDYDTELPALDCAKK